MENPREQTFVGLDVHRKSVTATAFDAAGSRVSQEGFGASDVELTQYLERLPGQQARCPRGVHALGAFLSTPPEATGASVCPLQSVQDASDRRGQPEDG